MWNLGNHGKEPVLKAMNTCVIVIIKKKQPTSFSKSPSCAWHCDESSGVGRRQRRCTMMNKTQPSPWRTCSLVKKAGQTG